MKITKYSVSKNQETTRTASGTSGNSGSFSTDDTTQLIDSSTVKNLLNDWFVVVDGVLVCKLPLASVDEITAKTTLPTQ